MARSSIKHIENFFEGFIFWGRWIQLPMYCGLLLGAFIYIVKFFQELYHLWASFLEIPEEKVMLYLLGLVDVTMVINLVVMVTIGGYSIFTSRLDLDQNEDKPMWLEGLDAGKLKIKLASSLASISGVHLLKTFIDIRGAQEFEGISGILVEVVIHLAFILSAWMLAVTERIQHPHGTDHGESNGDKSHGGASGQIQAPPSRGGSLPPRGPSSQGRPSFPQGRPPSPQGRPSSHQGRPTPQGSGSAPSRPPSQGDPFSPKSPFPDRPPSSPEEFSAQTSSQTSSQGRRPSPPSRPPSQDDPFSSKSTFPQNPSSSPGDSSSQTPSQTSSQGRRPPPPSRPPSQDDPFSPKNPFPQNPTSSPGDSSSPTSPRGGSFFSQGSPPKRDDAPDEPSSSTDEKSP